MQTASGVIHTDVDFASKRAGYLVVTGNAALGGKIVPTVATVLPNVNVPVMILDGTVTGTIQGSHSTLFEYDVQDRPDEITLSARSTGFAPAGFGIRGAAAEDAAYLEPVFDTATTPELGTLFANLGTLADAGAAGYIGALLGSFSINSTSRTISIPGFQSTLSGHPDVDTEAALLRADYTFGLGHAISARP